ncbi:hypothetical protein C5Y93_10655 [Blastopirellula marina]|uniref:Uncharacterized protein n=1 Tax=Blastopirellula marina TaxID=124 RepID=A0A2S8GPV1_9BACT|nr:hypothetical protein C5Y93_10655 [Blastopirellula marina]
MTAGEEMTTDCALARTATLGRASIRKQKAVLLGGAIPGVENCDQIFARGALSSERMGLY